MFRISNVQPKHLTTYLVEKTQKIFCVCCGSNKDYKGHFTCSRVCANNYQNKNNTNPWTAGLSCKYCVECGAQHPSPVVNSSPFCKLSCQAQFKNNCRYMGNSEPRNRVVPRQNNNGNRINGRNQQGTQFVFVQQTHNFHQFQQPHNLNRFHQPSNFSLFFSQNF